MTVLLIAVFGLLGIFSRYGLDQLFVRAMIPFPLSTFVINLVGSFFAGFVYAVSVLGGRLSPQWSTPLIVGFAGGFTTFSAYCLQTLVHWEQNKLSALFYFVGSPILGLLFCALGLSLGRLMH